MALLVKNPLGNSGDQRDAGSIPGPGRSPGGEQGNPPQTEQDEWEGAPERDKAAPQGKYGLLPRLSSPNISTVDDDGDRNNNFN